MSESEEIEKLQRELAQSQSQRKVLADELANTTELLEERIQGLSGVRRIVDALKHTANLPRVFEAILDAILQETTAENCSLMQLDLTNGTLGMRAAKGQQDQIARYHEDVVVTPFEIGKGVAGYVADSGHIVSVADVSTDARFVEVDGSDQEIGSLLCLPLGIDGQVIGIVNASHPHPNNFQDNDERLLGLMADQIALVLSNIQILDETQRLNHLLSEERQRLQGLVDNLPNGVCLLEEDGRVAVANPYASAYLQVLVGDKKNPDSLSALGGRSIKDFITPQSDGVPHEVVVDDQIFEIEVSPTVQGTTTGGMVLVIRDVTLERESQSRLEQQGRLAAVGQLAAGIAHDFNNLLTTVIGYAQLLELTQDLSEDALDRVRTIASQGERATQLIQQILDFSRKSPVQRKPLALVPFVKEVVKLLERTLPESIRIETNLRGENHRVLGNVTQLQQVFTNLAVNARDAMGGTGDIGIGLEAIEVGGEQPAPLPDMEFGQWVKWTVSDTGSGMPPDILERIFEPFFSTKSAKKGTGLGLSQVYGIVKQHGGEIEVQSEIGVGSVFTIYLPQESEKDVDTLSSGSAPTEGLRETVLIVEDEEDVREMTKQLLEHLNYQVLTATNGQEALTEYKKHIDDVDVILSDVVMPQFGGLELARFMHKAGIKIPIVLMTGYHADLAGSRFPGNVVVCLEKPLDLSRLGQALRDALDLSSE